MNKTVACVAVAAYFGFSLALNGLHEPELGLNVNANEQWLLGEKITRRWKR